MRDRAAPPRFVVQPVTQVPAHLGGAGGGGGRCGRRRGGGGASRRDLDLSMEARTSAPEPPAWLGRQMQHAAHLEPPDLRNPPTGRPGLMALGASRYTASHLLRARVPERGADLTADQEAPPGAGRAGPM